MPFPQDYEQRVYAGVLGKIIGVYLGRPFEGWSHERIMARFGEINYYVNGLIGAPLVVPDDDIAGTFTFLRALEDYGYPRDLTPQQIGQTWLNYIVERRAIFWWGGIGNSTEHTAFLRLKKGIVPPHSGSAALNGRTVAEQVGAQIFVDGWAMVAPGEPDLAADLARRAACVSHDGEAIYAAQLLAAMEAQAFVEPDLNRLLETGLSLIPGDCTIARLVRDVRDWHDREADWRAARSLLMSRYGPARYPGPCHVVPNHGVVILSLLYGADDFQRSLMLANTSGLDTDCNSGSVGCLLGIKNGIAGLEQGPDWRGPVADRLYLCTADGGRAVSDAVTETYHIVNASRALHRFPPTRPKGGARFHFEMPGSVQGFRAEDGPDCQGTLSLTNEASSSGLGCRSLALHYHGVSLGRPARAAVATFIPQEAFGFTGYTLLASPTLYPGQTVRARVTGDPNNHTTVCGRLFVRHFVGDERLALMFGPPAELSPKTDHEFVWRVPDPGNPIVDVGLELSSIARADGTVYLDYFTWDGDPDAVLGRPKEGGVRWRRSWVKGVTHFGTNWPEPFHIAQNEGRGLLITGTRTWHDYRVSTTLSVRLASAAGLAIRVQGLRRYYALLLSASGDRIRLVKALDGERVLAEAEVPWQFEQSYDLALQAVHDRLRAWLGQRLLFDLCDSDRTLAGGGIGLVCEEGCLSAGPVTVRPACP